MSNRKAARDYLADAREDIADTSLMIDSLMDVYLLPADTTIEQRVAIVTKQLATLGDTQAALTAAVAIARIAGVELPKQ